MELALPYSWRDGAESLERSRWLEWIRHKTREERAAHRKLWGPTEGVFQVFSWVLIIACKWGHSQWLGKNNPKGSVPTAHTGPGILPVPMEQSENLMIHGELGRVPSRSCLSNGELLVLKEAMVSKCLINRTSNTQRDQIVSRHYNHISEQS